MLIRAATCRGLMHRANGTQRQDAFALGTQAGPGAPSVVAVVCDGVGQFGRSDEAALFTSRRLAVLGAEGMPWPDGFACNEELAKMAAEAQARPMARTPGNGHHCRGRVGAPGRRRMGWRNGMGGDSTLWHLNAESRWTLLTDSASGDDDADYHTTAVRPLPSADGGAPRASSGSAPGRCSS